MLTMDLNTMFNSSSNFSDVKLDLNLSIRWKNGLQMIMKGDMKNHKNLKSII